MAKRPSPNKQPDLVGLEADGPKAPSATESAPPKSPAVPAAPPVEASAPAAPPEPAKAPAKPAAIKKAPTPKVAPAKAPKVAARAAPAPVVKAPVKTPPPAAKPAPKAKPAAKAAPAKLPPPPLKVAKPEAPPAKARTVSMAETVPNATKLPPQFREMAERNVDQAKKAYEQYVSTTERMLNTLEDAARQAWSGARDVNLRMLGFADANAQAGFDYAERLVRAKDVKEIASLQQEYLKAATERVGQQMQEIQQMASQAAKDAMKAAKPKS